jgi:hypothetical protein
MPKRRLAPISIILAVLAQVGSVCMHGQALPESPQQQSLLAAPQSPAFLMSTPESDVTPSIPAGARSLAIPGDSSSSRAANPALADTAPTGTRFKASTYVPIDSWIYPALDRLAALGYLQTSSTTIRPLTRLECARLVEEAQILYGGDAGQGNGVPEALLDALDREFAHELQITDGNSDNSGGLFEGVYARYTGISGTPLRDSFHFSQTIVDDFGRPYGHGANVIGGLSGHAEYRSFAIYVRGEYQHGAANTAYSPAAQQAIVSYDQLTEGWTTAPGAALPGVFNYNPAAASRPRFIEAYVAVNLANWQISAGQESLWWGPDRTTSLILSNNAAAMPMIRIARSAPARLPGFLGNLGPIHFDAFLARQGGIHYVALGPTFILHGSENSAVTPPPYLWGVTFSIEPTRNLELSFAHTTIFAGYGRPFTFGTFLHTFSAYGNAQAVDPGKRVTEFNLAYHVPWFRHRVTAYTEAMAWDDPIQGHFTERYALAPGIYLPQVPYAKKLDLRLEGVYTDLPGLHEEGYFYANAHYPQGYTNYGQVLGSWIGREGRGGAGTSTYWFSPRTKAALSYRRMVANPVLLGGGNLTDVSGSFTWLVNPRLEVSTVQGYDRWRFPILSATPRSSYAATFQVQLLNRPRP